MGRPQSAIRFQRGEAKLRGRFEGGGTMDEKAATGLLSKENWGQCSIAFGRRSRSNRRAVSKPAVDRLAGFLAKEFKRCAGQVRLLETPGGRIRTQGDVLARQTQAKADSAAWSSRHGVGTRNAGPDALPRSRSPGFRARNTRYEVRNRHRSLGYSSPRKPYRFRPPVRCTSF